MRKLREHQYVTDEEVRKHYKPWIRSTPKIGAGVLRANCATLLVRRMSKRQTERWIMGHAPIPESVIKISVIRERCVTIELGNFEYWKRRREVRSCRVIHVAYPPDFIGWTAKRGMDDSIARNCRARAYSKIGEGVRLPTRMCSNSDDSVSIPEEVPDYYTGLAGEWWGRPGVLLDGDEANRIRREMILERQRREETRELTVEEMEELD